MLGLKYRVYIRHKNGGGMEGKSLTVGEEREKGWVIEEKE